MLTLKLIRVLSLPIVLRMNENFAYFYLIRGNLRVVECTCEITKTNVDSNNRLNIGKFTIELDNRIVELETMRRCEHNTIAYERT